MRRPDNTKIFCIGFHKTGTTSLAEALRILGYKVTGPNGVRDPNIAQNALKISDLLISKYDAFQDNPWPVIYKELDKKYPGSKFILTLRDPQAWIRSQIKHFGTHETPMRKWIYGSGAPKGNENIYIKRFNQHNQEVISYFRDRPGDLLVMDFAEGDGWNKLCSFLGKRIPGAPFPHSNASGDRNKIIPKFISILKEIKRKLSFFKSHP